MMLDSHNVESSWRFIEMLLDSDFVAATAGSKTSSEIQMMLESNDVGFRCFGFSCCWIQMLLAQMLLN